MSIWDYFNGSASPEQSAGLLGLATGFTKAAGSGREPVNFGAALAAGAAGMQQGRDQYADRQQQQAVQALKLRAAQGDLEAQERLQQEQMALQQAAQSAVGPDGQFNQDAFLRTLRSTNALKAIELEQKMAKAGPEFSTTPQTGLGPDGKPFQYLIAKNGEMKRLDGVLPRDELKLANLGGKDVAYNPFALQDGQTFQRTMTPGETASNGIARANLGISQQRLAMDQRSQAGGAKAPQGYRFMPDGTLMAIPGGPSDAKASKEGVQKVQDARDVLSVLDEAEPLLSKSTSSYAGAGIDQIARTFGKSTDGAEAAAKLKVLQGALVAKMPKMSGPQSDKDVQLYREMAGQIGDSTLPESTRSAAAAQLRTLTQKYLDGTGAAAAPVAPKAAAPARPAASIPPGAANMLKMNPRLREQFDAKYGAGAAASVLGK